MKNIYIDQSIFNQPNDLTDFYIIQGSFGKVNLELTLVKVQDGATKFLVIDILEY